MGFQVKPQSSKSEPSLNKTFRLKETMINELQKFINNATENLKIADNSTFNTLKKNFFENLKEIDTGNIANMIIGGTMSAVGIISNLCLGLMIGFYLLFDYHKICKKIKNTYK